MAKGSKKGSKALRPSAPVRPGGSNRSATPGEASRKLSPRAKAPNPTADPSQRATRKTYARRSAANRKPGGPTDPGAIAGSTTDSGVRIHGQTPTIHLGESPAVTTDSGGAKPGPRTGKGPNAGSWQPGQSGNPKGAPRRGESWREMVKSVGDRTLAEALERYPWLADKIPDKIRPYATVNDTLTLKEVVVANVFGALIEAPDSALWNGLMNRAEGAPEQPVELTWKAELAEWLRDGKVSLDEIKGRLSDELFAEFTVYVGAAIPGAG